MNAALELARSDYNVILVDKKNYHLFQPLLYQVATGGLSPGDISFPLRAAFKRHKNVFVIMDEVLSIDPAKRQVMLKQQNLVYDYLIVAAGSHHHYFGNDSWENWAPSLKSIQQATQIRSRILMALEEAEARSDSEAEVALPLLAAARLAWN